MKGDYFEKSQSCFISVTLKKLARPETFGPYYVADFLDEGARIDAIITDFSKDFDLVPYGLLLMKIAASGLDSRAVVWVGDFL